MSRREHPIQSLNLSGNRIENVELFRDVLSIKALGSLSLVNTGVTRLPLETIRTSGRLYFLDLRKNALICEEGTERDVFRNIKTVMFDDGALESKTLRDVHTRYVCDCAYDGTDYAGWQAQTSKRTIQGTIEKVLFRVFGSCISIVGSGRTDAGVHARHQVFHFDAVPFEKTRKGTDVDIPATLHIQRLMNILLPHSIRIKRVYENSSKSFHARTCVKRKRYVYTFRVVPHDHIGGTGDIFHSRSISEVRLRRKSKVDIKTFVVRLFEIASVFLGKHDFTAFAVMNKDDDRSVIRTLSRCEIAKDDSDLFCVTLECDFFLYNMCRRIVGLMLEYAHGNVDSIDIARCLLRGPNNFKVKEWKKLCVDHIRTAEAKGLRMDGIYYGGFGVMNSFLMESKKSDSSEDLYFGD